MKISAQQEAVAALNPKKFLQVQIGREVERAVKKFGPLWRKELSLHPPGIEPPNSQLHIPLSVINKNI